ncbi:MAG: hypothetical protein J5586_02785 [Clostridia bacterium]|nr:hypothetical protein [Clostridia bacterium]
MEIRRRRRPSRRKNGASSGGGVRALILLMIFGAAAYLIIGTGVGRKLRESRAYSLLSGLREKIAATQVPSFEPRNTLFTDLTPSPTAQPTGETASVSLPALDVYMLQFGIYETAEALAPYAEALRAMGAAGYTYDDSGSLRLIGAAYSTEEQAESVRQRMITEGRSCTVFRLSRSGAELLITAPQERLLPIRTAFSLASEVVGELDSLVIDFDAMTRSIEYGMGRLAEIRQNIMNALAGISDGAETNGTLGMLCGYYADVTGFIDAAYGSSASRAEFTSALKELRIKAAVRYASLLEGIGG